MDRDQKTKLYFDYLNEEGYRPTVDSLGDIVFKKEGGVYCLVVIEDDDNYFRLLFPNFWKINNDEEKKKSILVCNEINQIVKVVKLCVDSNNTVVAAAELLLPTPEDFKVVFDRAMSVIATGVGQFAKQMLKTPETKTPANATKP